MATEDKNLKSGLKKKVTNNSEGEEFKIAQSLDESELNNLSNSPSLEALSPEENVDESPGIPVESFPENNNQNLITSDTDQVINTNELEGLANNAAPKEGFSNNVSDDSIIENEIPPSVETLQGSPAQGITNIQESEYEETNIQNIPPETLEQIGAPETLISDSLENMDNQNEEEITTIPPEETITNAGPINSVLESLPLDEDTNIIEEGPQEETLMLARPQETQVVEEDNTEEQISEDIMQLAPEQSLSAGRPSQTLTDAEETVFAESSISPEESDISGRPAEEESQSNRNLQLAEVDMNTDTQLKPENTNAKGNPQEGISLEVFRDSEDILIPPENITTLAGLPQEGEVPESAAEKSIQITKIEPLKPTEETLQDYVNNMAEKVLEKSLEKGETPQEATIAALQAGKEAAKEVSADSEEMKELSFNLGENIINDINNKIEKIQNTIEEKKQQEIKVAEATTEPQEQVEPQVAEATTEPQEQVEPQVAEATIEPQEQVETQVAGATTEPQEQVEPQVAEATIEPQEQVEPQVAEATTEPQEQEESEVAEATIEPQEQEESEVAEATIEPQEQVEPQVAGATTEPQEQVEPQVAEATIEPQEQEESEVAEATIEPQEQVEPQEQLADANIGASSIIEDNQNLGLDSLAIQNDIIPDIPSVTQEIEEIQELQTLAESEVQDSDIADEAEITDEQESSDQELDQPEDDEVQIASSENNTSLGQDLSLVIGEGENNQLFGTNINPVTSTFLTPVSTSANLNLASSNNFNSISNLGNLSPVSSSISLLGDTNIQDSILETSNFDESDTEIDDATDEGFVEYGYNTDNEEEEEEEESDDSGSGEVINTSVINPTNQNDNIIGGIGDTEFLYDFSSANIGGNDVLSDQGNTINDRIFFKNIPDNHSVWISRDDNTNVGMRIETFNTHDPAPTSHNNSINTITTLVSDGSSGIEDFYFSTDSTDYNSSSSFAYEKFYELGSSSIKDMVQIITGNSANNSYLSSLPSSGYKHNFSDASEYSAYQGYVSSVSHPYDQTVLDARIFLAKEGNDSLTVTNNFHTQYIADMGAGNDTLEYGAYGTNSPPIKEGSYFDGGLGTDTLKGSAVADHYGWNSSNYSDSAKPTNASILESQGTSVLISSTDSSYFDNFETINANLGNDSFFLAGDPGNDITLQGEYGQDNFEFNYAFSSNILADGGNDNDTFTISNSQYTGKLELDGGLNDDTLKGSSLSDHYGWSPANYSDSSIATNSAILSGKGTASLISSIDKSYFSNIETITANQGADTFYFGGDPSNNLTLQGNAGNDEYHFNYNLTKNITAVGGADSDVFTITKSPSSSGVLTMQGNGAADQFNFSSNITNGTIVTYGNAGTDTFQFDNANITSNVTLYTGDDADKLSFVSKNSGSNLEVSDFSSASDYFEFNSAAFSGSDGHVLVFGTVQDHGGGANEFVANNIGGNIVAFDNTNTQIGTAPGTDLLSRNDDLWLYDTSSGYLYYDEDGDQFMDDAVTIAKVKNSGNILDNTTFKSSDIQYDDDGATSS